MHTFAASTRFVPLRDGKQESGFLAEIYSDTGVSARLYSENGRWAAHEQPATQKKPRRRSAKSKSLPVKRKTVHEGALREWIAMECRCLGHMLGKRRDRPQLCRPHAASTTFASTCLPPS